MGEDMGPAKFVVIDKWRIRKNTITNFGILTLHPKYPLNPPGTDYLPLSSPGAIWNSQTMQKINQAEACYVLDSDLPAWQAYVEQNALIQKNMPPDLAVQKIEDVGVHLLEVSRNNKLDDTVVAEFQGVATGVVDLLRSSSDAVRCIRTLVEHSAYTYFHSVGVGILAPAIALELGEKQDSVLREFALGGLLHDIGKLDISDDIINKPAKLDPEEWELVRKHPHLGLEKLSAVKGIPERVKNMVAQHHEKMNGRGYPAGLSGEKIPHEARIAAIADIFNALNTTRSYHQKRNTFESLMLIRHSMKDEVWDPALNALIKILSKDMSEGNAQGKLKSG